MTTPAGAIVADILPAPRWYVAHTNAGAEFVVQRGMKRRGIDCILLYHMKATKHSRKVCIVPRPLMSRYVIFAIGPDQSMYQVTKIMGVSTIVRNMDGPLEVPLQIVDKWRSKGDEAGLVSPAVIKERERWKPGHMLHIQGNGPLAGFIAEVSLDDGPAVRIWVDAFGGRVLATVSPTELAEPAP